MYAQELPDKSYDSSGETLDITIPSPSFSGHGSVEFSAILTTPDLNSNYGEPFYLLTLIILINTALVRILLKSGISNGTMAGFYSN